jgi:hypothetical protein
MEWSARNPDLNPTQHLQHNMEKRLRAMEGHPNHFSQLTRVLLDIWENIGQNHNRNLILTCQNDIELKLTLEERI